MIEPLTLSVQTAMEKKRRESGQTNGADQAELLSTPCGE
jgi:hypothetical protein